MQPIPSQRLRVGNTLAPNSAAQFVLYWMRSARRPLWNFALQHATQRALERHKPLLILETLACDDPFASVRHHHFALDGMADNNRHFEGRSVTYIPWVEKRPQQIQAGLRRLAENCCLLVTDAHPLLEKRRELARVAEVLPVALEAVDSNGILPLQAAQQPFSTAYAFRRFLQRQLPGHLLSMPLADPLAEVSLPRLTELPAALAEAAATAGDLLYGSRPGLSQLPIDGQVKPVQSRGGYRAADELFQRFLGEGLPVYADQRNQPQQPATSQLSAHLRWGHIGSHQLVQQLLELGRWNPGRLAPDCRGQRSGWWGLDKNTEAFLDQLITWRELGYLFCQLRDDYQQFEALPDWAQQTLERHADDPRPYLYSTAELVQARTHDPLWNAAQRQLLREGQMHNYLRMLWGKKILEWSPSPRQALETLIEINDRFALDGRDPNSYSGIGWCLGRFDRAWGPRRPIFGTIRYMSSTNTARKVNVRNYLKRYGESEET